MSRFLKAYVIINYRIPLWTIVVTGVIFTFPTKILCKIYDATVLKTMDNRQCRIKISDRQKANKMSPTTAPACCLERISRQQLREGNLRWSEPISLRWGVKAGTLGKAKQLEFTGKSRRECREQRFTDYSTEYWLTHAYEETTWGQKKLLQSI